MLAGAIRLGSPVDFGRCRACNQRVAWVRVRQGWNIALDPEPHPEGTYAVLSTGWKAIDLDDHHYRRERDAIRHVQQRTNAPLYMKHWTRCPAKGMRHAGRTARTVIDGYVKQPPR